MEIRLSIVQRNDGKARGKKRGIEFDLIFPQFCFHVGRVERSTGGADSRL